MHREQVMDVLWPGLGRRAASNNLRQVLHVARKIFDSDPGTASRYLALRDEQLVLCPDENLWVDAEVFEEVAFSASRSREPDAYEAATDLYVGELLPEDRYEDWTEGRRRELRETYLSILMGLASAQEERGDYSVAIEALRKVIREDPTNEEAYISSMRLYSLLGRKVEALRHYELLRQTISQEQGAEPSASTRALREEIASSRFPPQEVQPLGSPSREAEEPLLHNLPIPRTSFVDRQRELTEIKRTLAMTRLLTLTGTGGSGKTRLALKAATILVGAHPDGEWFVELAALSEPNLVLHAIAGAVGAREQPGRPIAETVTQHLREKRGLLILDNCEHLVDAAARLVDFLLTSCPHLRILATSREPLDVEGEVLISVPPLPVPAGLPADSSKVGGNDSVRLFVERARLRLPSFLLTQENARSVVAVCRRLEGLPLAIELAAARMGTLATDQMAQRLEDSLGLLSTGPRTVPPRQRTMRAAIGWSYGLLSEPEKGLFGRLSVFAGGFTLEAAEAVCAGGAIEEGEVLDLLSNLVDKSLVLAETSTEGRVRYRMLEPVRQYAREQLEESREAEAVRQRHATFFLALAKEAKPNLRGPQQVAWLERLEREHDNIRAVLSWSLARRPAEQGERAVLGIRLASALWRFWESYGYPSEGHQWLERCLSGSSVPSIVQAEALNGAGYLALLQGDYQLGITRLEESIALFKELEDEPGLANSLSNLGIALLLVGDREGVTPLREDAEALRRGMLDQQVIIDLLIFLGMVALDESDYEQMALLLEEGLALSRDLGDVRGMTACLTVLGLGLLKQGNHERAALLLEECLYLTARRIRHMLGTAYSMLGLAAVAALRGQPARAARLWGAAEALREVIGQPLAPYDDSNYDYEGYLDAARSQLDEPDWKAAWLEGRTMRLEQAVAYALGESEEPVSTATSF